MSDLKKIWKKVRPTIEAINSYYLTISDQLSDNDARKLYTIRLYFISLLESLFVPACLNIFSFL